MGNGERDRVRWQTWNKQPRSRYVQWWTARWHTVTWAGICSERQKESRTGRRSFRMCIYVRACQPSHIHPFIYPSIHLLTLPLPRVIKFKFALQPHQKYNITRYGELGFHSLLRWKMIILPILTTSLLYFSSKGWENVTLWSWEWKGWNQSSTHHPSMDPPNHPSIHASIHPYPYPSRHICWCIPQGAVYRPSCAANHKDHTNGVRGSPFSAGALPYPTASSCKAAYSVRW